LGLDQAILKIQIRWGHDTHSLFFYIIQFFLEKTKENGVRPKTFFYRSNFPAKMSHLSGKAGA